MKKLTLLLVIILFVYSNNYSQGIPETINYQGILKDASGVVVPDGNYNIIFQLCEAESGGTVFWEELQTINVIDGILNAELGTIAPIPQTIFENPAWLSIIINGGTPLSLRIPLTSVPYSFLSMTVPDGSLTASKIADGEVVKSVNGIKDIVNLVAGSNVTITPSGNDLTISSTGGGGGTIGGSGSSNFIPMFTNSTTLGSSTLYDAGSRIGLGTTTPDFSFTINSTPTFGRGLKVSRAGGGLIGLAIMEDVQPTSLRGWSFECWNQKLRINAAGDDGITTLKNLMTFDREGNVGIGTETPLYPLHIATNRKYAGYFITDSLSHDAHALHGEFLGTGDKDAVGVYGKSVPADYYGYGGYFQGGFVGVRGVVQPTGSSYYSGVQGVIFQGGAGYNYGVYGEAMGGIGTNIGIYGTTTGGATSWAGYFSGNVNVTGTISKGGGSFKIDHPLDPTNKNLYHSFVESPDMMNIYNGNIITDGSGYATVTMPNWFEALNQDFRYQLTVIGDFAQAIVSQKIQNNQFIIRTDKPNIEVSWQVTGIRHDKFAEKNRIPVEENKTGKDVGRYLHPDAYGVSETLGVDYENNRVDKEHSK
ncbi:MAG: hypothetical protein IPJ23_00305 [Ignavibacteriales bacterium]|nr:hypothetical protein [Ignavibacteriales bacterium]